MTVASRAAHRVGFMREGRLLAEDSPQVGNLLQGAN